MRNITTITQKGQVTIPLVFRQQLGLSAGDKVTFSWIDEGKTQLALTSVPRFSQWRGSIKSTKKYSKEAARKAYLPSVMQNEV